MDELSYFLEQDLIGIVLQYLKEKGYDEAAHKYVIFLLCKTLILINIFYFIFHFFCFIFEVNIFRLESETKYYFDMKHCKELFMEGKWDNLMTYLRR